MPGARDEHITIRCGSCDKRIKLPVGAAGKRVKCLGCGGVFVVPSVGAAGPQTGAGRLEKQEGERIHFACEGCGAKIKVRRAAAGKRVKCPKCGSVLTVPALEPPDAPTDIGSAGLGDGDALLDDLAAAEQSGTATAPLRAVAAATPCPECGTALAPGMAVCVACGYDAESGKKHKAASVETGIAASAAAAVEGAAKFAGSFVLACVVSALGAGVGACIWFGVAMATEREFGWIAWGLGGLAGLSMYVVQRRDSVVAGTVAAGMAVGGIIAAKALIFYFVLAPLVNSVIDDEYVLRDAVTAYVANETYTAEGYTEDDESPEAIAAASAAMQEAEERVAAMSDEEVRELAEEVKQEVRSATEAAFFEVMFSWWDVIFILLAVVTAFRVGAGGIGFER